ncbi:hypothetical protein [Vibrio metschnikovii]|uniref:hypothetical protein n=1 Tax=Vibrio metschnikovii TaxID=28172 RepID=UPI00130211BE|nr:hypothetical protein [Vibrio metschnikovii]
MKDVDKKLRELAVRHAEISSEIKITQDHRAKEISSCTGGEYLKPTSESGEDFSFMFVDRSDSFTDAKLGIFPWEKPNCIEMTYHAMVNFNKRCDDGYGYDELLQMYGCEHCQKARQLKKDVGKLKQERGRIHSAITNIGKTL